MSKKGFTYTLQIDAEINDLIAKTNQVKKSMQSIMDAGKAPGAEKIFGSIERAIDRLQTKASQPIESVAAFASLQKDAAAVGASLGKLGSIIENLGNMDVADKLDLLPPNLKKQIEEASVALDVFSKAQAQAAQKSQALVDAETDLAAAQRELKKAEGKVQEKKALIAAQQSLVNSTHAEADAIKAKIEALKKYQSTVAAYEAAGGDKRKVGGGKDELAGLNLPADRNAAKKVVAPGFDLGNTQAVADEIARLTAEYTTASKAVTDAESTQRRYSKQLNEATNAATVASGKVTTLKQSVAQLNQEFEKNKAKNVQVAYAKLRTEAGKLGIDLTKIPVDYTEQNLLELNDAMNKLAIDGIAQVDQGLNVIETDMENTGVAANNLGSKMTGAAADVNKLDTQVSQTQAFTQRIAQFVGLEGGIEIARSAMRNAISTIKELDKAMTEMAVVTDLDVGDYWDQLPEYAARANELGVSIKSAYESATLYYQQGLKTNEVVAMSNETLKMARIAGLSAEDATNKMTAALRGFNMELDETSAQRVSDVYSELAAITASDVNEISSAMTKTASIAASAGMEFETTAAFLSQIIETTRESAETAGTALKTVIARFQELKKDPAEIGEVDGEVVDANKIETALRSVGVALRDTSGQFRDLDDVFLELASKWQDLDTNTQRYIATIAAGSRQQSRFIAMMSDYARTTDLVAAANTSAGASQEQFEKTMDSLESKLNELKNAWDTFTMGIMDSDILKAGVDILTAIITALNKISDLFGRFSGAAKIGMVVAALYLGDKALNIFNKSLKKGDSIFRSFGNVGKAAVDKIKNGFTGLQKLLAKITGKKINIDLTPAKKAMSDYTKATNNQIAAQKLRTSVENNAALTAEARAARLASLNEIEARSEQRKTAALVEYATAQGMTSGQTAALLALQSAGVGLDLAEAAAMGGLTAAKILDYQASMIAQGLDASEIATRMTQIATLYAEAGAENVNTNSKKAGIAAIWAKISAGVVHVASLIAETVAQWALNIAVYAGCPPMLAFALIVLILVAAIALVVVGIIALVGWFKKMIANSPEGKLKSAKEAAEVAGEAAEEAKEAFEGLNDAFESLADKYAALEELTQGTKEWRDAVREINNEVMDLVDQYPELASLIKNENGVLTINLESEEAQAVLRDYEARAIKTSAAEIASKINVLNAQTAVDYKALSDQATIENEAAIAWQKAGAVVAGSLIAGTGHLGQGTVAGAAIWKEAEYREERDKMKTNSLAEAMGKGYLVQKANGDWKAIENFDKELEELGITAEEAEKLANSLGEASDELKDFGKQLTLREQQEAALYDALAVSIVEMVDTTKMAIEEIAQINTAVNEEYIKYFESVVGREETERMQRLGVDGFKEYLEKIAMEIYGTEEVKANKYADGVTVGSGDDEKEVTNKNLILQYKKMKGAEKAAEAVQNLPQAIDAMMRRLGKNAGAFENAYAGKEGSKMTKADAEALQNITTQEWRTMFDSLSDTEKKAFGGFESYMKVINESSKITIDNITAIEERFKNLKGDYQVQGYLTTEAASGYSEWLEKVLIESGQEGIKKVNDALNNIYNSTSTEDFNAFMAQVNSIDPNALESWEELPNILKQLKINIPNDSLQEFINTAKEANQAIYKMDLNKIIESFQQLSKISKDILSGKQYRAFDSSTYDIIAEKLPEELNKFILDEEGQYIYLGTKMDELCKAIDDNTSAILGDITKQQEARWKTGDIITENWERVEYEGTTYALKDSNIWEADIKATYLQNLQKDLLNNNINIGALGIDNFGSANKIGDLYRAEGGVEKINQIFEGIVSLWSTYQDEEYEKSLQGQTTAELKNNAAKSVENRNKLLESAEQGLKDLDISTRAEFESTFNNVLVKAVQKGVNQVDIEAYTKATDTLKQMLNFGITPENEKEYKELLNYVKTLEKEIVDTINTNTLNENLQLALEGFSELGEELDSISDDAIKIEKLQKSVEKLGIVVNEENVAMVETLVNNIIAGGEEGYNSLGILFRSAAIQAGFDGEMAAQLWTEGWNSSMGLLDTKMQELLQRFENFGLGSWSVENGESVFKTLSQSKYDTSWSLLDIETDEWVSSYDWMYNANEKINDLIREREKLERKYQRTLKDSNISADALLGTTKEELEVLKSRAETAAAIMKSSSESITGLFSNNPEFAKFIGISETGRITVDYVGAEAAFGNNSEQGGAFEEMVSIVEELVQTGLDAQESLYDIEDDVDDIKDRGKDEYFDLEQRVFDALVYKYESEIKKLEDINDTLDETNNNLLEAIQQGIEESRQARENDKTESDIEDKRSRLAYLQADSSGSNALEILKLQKEIEEDTEAYQDSQIDQAIEKLQRDNDEAARQRERQISLMQSQLDWAKESGAIWGYVKTLWDSAFKTDGALDMDSQMVKVLKGSEGWKAMSDLAKTEWAKELQSDGALGKLWTELGNDTTGIPKQIADINTLVRGTWNIPATNKNIQDTFDAKLSSQSPSSFADDTKFQSLYTSLTKAITGGEDGDSLQTVTGAVEGTKGTSDPQTLEDVESAITTEVGELSVSVSTMFSNASAAIDAAKATAEAAAEQAKQNQKDIKELQDLTDSEGEYVYNQTGEWNSYEDAFEPAQALGMYLLNKDSYNKHRAEGNPNLQQKGGYQEYLDEMYQQYLEKLSKISITGYVAQREGALSEILNTEDVANGENDDGRWFSNKGTFHFKATGISPLATNVAKYRDLPNLSLFKMNNNYYVYKDGLAYSLNGEIDFDKVYDWAWGSDWGKNMDFNFGKGTTEKYRKYASGGLADFTGPAWLDGTKSKPEIVLNQTDSANFMQLRDILADILNGTSGLSQDGSTIGGDNYFDIEISVDSLNSDYDVEQLADKIRGMIYDDATYRNVNTINSVR